MVWELLWNNDLTDNVKEKSHFTFYPTQLPTPAPPPPPNLLCIHALCSVNNIRLQKLTELRFLEDPEGLSWRSSGYKSMLPLLGAQV